MYSTMNCRNDLQLETHWKLVEMRFCCRDQETNVDCKRMIVSNRLSSMKARSSTKHSSIASPYYANEKFDIYYPKKKSDLGVQFGDTIASSYCPITGETLDYIMNMDLTPVLDKVDANKNDVLRTIKRLDEKLNSPVCRFLEAYQPDVPCACEETALPDARCPCPPEKEPLHFDLGGRKHGVISIDGGQQDGWSIGDRTVKSPTSSRRQPAAQQTSKRDEIEKQVEALDEKLCSPEFHFLKPLEPEQIARCACQNTNFPQAHCACLPIRKPIDFRDKIDVQNKINAIDGLLKSPNIGLTCKCQQVTLGPISSSTKKSVSKASHGDRNPRSCQANCPLPRCRCGKDCPAKPGPFRKFPERTFHVPECPRDSGSLVQPRSPVPGAMACPFSPACCPIAEVCPFPVATCYDPSAPALPPVDAPRRCPLLPTIPSSVIGDPSRPPCPLDPLKPPRNAPSCPLKSPSPCPMGQQSDCPLLTCSLGPLKSIIFDGNEECPFCYAKCCPMISPDGPGCPISIKSAFCPLGNTNTCCLKGMSSAPQLPGSVATNVKPGPKNDEESCPIGELLEANAKISGCKCQGQQSSCPLTPPKPCPALSPFPQSSCYCGTRNTPGSSVEMTTRPDSCPLGNISIPPPVAPPCPLTFSSSQGRECPVTKIGNKNLDPSCPVSSTFECPALKKKPFSLPTSTTGEPVLKLKTTESKLELKNSERTRQQQLPQGIESIMHANSSDKKKQPRKSSPKVQKSKNISKPKTSKEAVATRQRSESIRKTDKEMTKTFSRISKIKLARSVSSGSEIFEVSLESLPRPPLSETRLLNTARATVRQPPPVREDASPLVKTSAPSDSKGFERLKGKPKPRNCPIPDPEPCPLQVPRCPFGPPEPSCPLARAPNCPLRVGKDGCLTGMMVSSQTSPCPAETTPCNLFPTGHCPMENLNMCECDFPIAPCLEPLIPSEDAEADDQYCSRLDCCMGLPLPPTKPSVEFETDTWYAYVDEKPGNPATKHYLEILDVPPEPEFFVSINEFRKHPAWKIIKYGEGYKKCKRISEILAARGPTATLGTQFVEDDLPDDEEIEIIRKNQQEAAETMERVRMSNLTAREWLH